MPFFLQVVAVLTTSATLFAQSNTPTTSEAAPDNASASYGGPSVLSRGLAPSVLRGADIKFRPYFGVSGICDSGLTAVSVDIHGHAPNDLACGVQASAGAYGSHSWRRTRAGISYSGAYRHFARYKYYDGTDQTLKVDLEHRLSKSWTISTGIEGGTYSLYYNNSLAGGIYDFYALPTPGKSAFDNAVRYATGRVDATYRLSARWSANFGGQALVTRYRSAALYGATGYGAVGDLVYRYNRFGTVGVSYQFDHTEFTHAFGSFDYHSLAGLYSLRISRGWELQLKAGVGRIESLALGTVTIDPVIAAITGQTTGVIAAHHLNYAPDLGARLSRGFRRAGLSFGYNRSVSAGNGLYAAALQENADARFSYTGIRQWGFSVMGGYTSYSGLLQTLGKFRSYDGGWQITRTLGSGLQAVMQVSGHHYLMEQQAFRRNAFEGSLGLSWSPGDLPLKLW